MASRTTRCRSPRRSIGPGRRTCRWWCCRAPTISSIASSTSCGDWCAPIARAREARSRVGVVPQFDNLDPDFTVAENLLVYGRYFGMSRAAVAARVPELLEFAGLAGRADARINTLSGGMKRRLTLARALINDPQ